MAEATVHDVAKRAGVSIATVSRALSGQDIVSEETRQKVLAVAEELHYQVNSHARSLRSSRSYTVGLLVSDIRNPFFAQLAHRILTDLAARGYATFIGSSAEDSAHQDSYLTSLMRQRIDGVILAPQGEDSRALHALIDQGVPVVFVDRTIRGFDVPSVDSDPAPGIEQALIHLKNVGHKKVGFVAGPLNTSTGTDRLAEFERIAPRVLGPDNALVAHGGYDERQAAAALEYLLSEDVGAVIFGYAPNTFVALREFRRLGLTPGRDIDLVSFDDIETFALIDPPISVISQEIEELGATAVRMLASLMRGETPESRRIPTKFIVRQPIGSTEKTGSNE